MPYTKKKLEDLNVIDDFLMNSLATDSTVGEEFCRMLLSTLLQRDIGKVHVTVQKVIPPGDPNLKGIRLDVKVEEPVISEETGEAVAMNIYDIEPHLVRGTDLPRHNRFYQAMTDSSNLKSGDDDYKHLSDLYILMILDKDPFGYDYMMYSIRNKCEEVAELEYNDGLRFYYFYTGGKKGGSDAIKTMLHYIRDSRAVNATDAATKEIHRYTEAVKIHPEVRKSYMFWEEYVELLKEELKETLREELKDTVKEEVREELKDTVKEEVREELKDTVKEEVREELKDTVKEEVREELKDTVKEEVREELKDTVKEEVKEELEDTVTEKIREKLENEVRRVGMAEATLELLKEYGEIPIKLREKILGENNMATLKQWHKRAAKVDSIEEFEKELQ